MKHVLIIRFSALGDVAILAKIMQEYEIKGAQPVVLTKNNFRALFDSQKVKLPEVDTKKKHKGLAGLIRLHKELKKEYDITEVLDLHNTLRSKIIKLLFALNGISYKTIDKGKREKRKLARKRNKIKRPLKTSKERYLEVLTKAKHIYLTKAVNSPNKGDIKQKQGEEKIIIGIAPFAAHKTKEYPVEKTEKVISKLKPEKYEILIFGGGKKEKEVAEKWEQKYPHVRSIIGKQDMTKEIELMQKADLMITMDSGNMHLASLTDTKILVIWGATHPYMGFAGDSENRIDIQIEMNCRPCSVFGEKKCRMNNLACMNLISESLIVNKIKELTKQM